MKNLATILFCTAALAAPARADDPATQPEARRPALLGISHIGLYVHNLEKSRAFYKDYLGFDEPYTLKDPDGALRLTWIKINDRQTLELFPEKSKDSPRAYHMALETTNSPLLRNYLASKGAKVPPDVKPVRIGNLNFMTYDPEGHAIEMVQYTDDGWTKKDDGQHLPPTRISDHLSNFTVPLAEPGKAIQWYVEVLGMTAPEVPVRGLRLQVPEGTDGITFIALDKNNPQAIGFTLEVPDVAKATATLAGRKLPEGCSGPTDIHDEPDGSKSAELTDPDGIRITLWARKPR